MASSSILLCWAAAVAAAEPGWLWDAPREHFHAVVCAADKEGTILQEPAVTLHDGHLLVFVRQNVYKSDAVIEDVRTRWQVSRDGGKTWERSAPVPRAQLPAAEGNDGYPCLAQRTPDGTLLAAGSFGWENSPDTPENRKKFADQGLYVFGPESGNAGGTISVIHRAWVQRSTDGGKTWEKSQIKLPVPTPHLACYGVGLVLRDGTFVQPMWGRLDIKVEPYVSSLLLRTGDKGASWTVHRIAGPKEFDLNETSVTQAANGDLVAIIRTTHQKDGVLDRTLGQHDLWTAISSDGGKTWTRQRDSGLRGSTPWIVTTKDGLVVAVFVRRETQPGGGGFSKTGVFACVSRDDGKTWDAEHQVLLFDGGTDFIDGYPSAIALPDGSVYAVYDMLGTTNGIRFHPRFRSFGG